MKYFRQGLMGSTLFLMLCMSGSSYAASSYAIEERPSGFTIAGDLLIARPALIAMTIAGTGLYIVGAPFAIAGGNLKESGETLVLKPAKAAFVRCLGCKSGRKQTTVK